MAEPPSATATTTATAVSARSRLRARHSYNEVEQSEWDEQPHHHDGEEHPFENDITHTDVGDSCDYEDDNDDVGIVRTRTPCFPCFVRLRHEWTNPLFDISEPGGKQIDIARTFAPPPMILSAPARIAFLGISLESLIATLVSTPPSKRWFFMAYLTHWGLVVAISYQIVALGCLIFRRRALYQPSPGERCSRLVRITWGLFSLAAPVELIICILFWGLDYAGGPIHYYLIINHGGVALLILIDGFLLSSYPLQMKQMAFSGLFCLMYLLWTLIFAYDTNIQNPNEQNDDYIYSVLEWRADPKDAEIIASLCAFVLPPIIFVTFFIVSLTRRHIYDPEEHTVEHIELVEGITNQPADVVDGAGNSRAGNKFTISDYGDPEII